MAVMFLQSLLPYLSLIKNTYASTPTNSEIDYSTDTNTLKLTVNTVDEVEYLVAYRSEKKIEAFQGKADASDQNFSREFYAGTCSTNDTCTPDSFKKVITKVRIETSNWTQVRRVVYIGGGFLTASEDSDGDVDKLSEEEEDWLNNQDDLDLQPTATPSPTTEVTPTGDILDGISVTATPTATPSVGQDGAVVTEVIESNACFANSLNGCVASEKPDYHPNEVVLLYGHGFEANTEYALVITSETDSYSGEYKITTDGNGSFFYSYQLENVYRPLYKVEVKDSEGNVVASTTFTDSPISGCAIDSAGANDETGQKDLTKMCVDYSGHPTSITTSWNWDEISWSGANTGDACSLFDNDGDGFVNYALCVGVNGNPAIEAYTKLYSCTDTKGYNCSGSSLISSSPSSSCATTLENTDPFAAGAGYPVDTQASCNVVMSEVGGSSSELVDVCSYPSGSPSSKASDCVVFKDKSGKLEVKKVLIPSDNTGLFNLQIDGATAGTGADAGDGDTTGEQVVTADDHTVGETAGTGTSLSNYSSSIVCKDLNGSGTTIASASNAGPLDIVVEEGDDIVCTITNTLQNGSVKVNKLLDGDSNGTFETSNPGAFTWSLDGSGTNVMGSTVSNVTPGSHNVNEASVSNYHFVGWYPTSSTQYTCSNIPQGNSTLPASVSVTSNATTEITLCNARDKGTIKVVKDVVPTDNSQWDVSVSGPTNNTDTLTDADDTGVLPSLTGSYTISETAHAGTTGSNYTSTWSCNNNTSGQGTSISNLTLAKDQNLVCTFTNTIKKGDVRVVKYHDHDADGTKDVGDEVLGDTGVGAEIEATRWAIKLVGDNVNSTQYTGAAVQGEVTFSDLLPGNFTLSEVIKTGWHQSNISCTGDQGIDNDNSHAVTVYPDTETTCYIGNYQKGTISGYKYDADGTTVIQNWSIDLYECLSDFSGCVLGASTTTDSNGFFSFANLNVGFYKVQEVVQSG